MLICDRRFGSHLDTEFLSFYGNNRIQLFFLLPHTSHILQLLDVRIFNVSKHWHGVYVEDASIAGCQRLIKDEFLFGIGEIRRKTFKASTIKTGWRLSVLWPINSRRITENLYEYDPYSRPQTPNEWTSGSSINTPQTAERFRCLNDRIDSLNPCSERFHQAVAALQKGTTILVQAHEVLQEELDRMEAVRSAHHARYNIARRYTRITGIVGQDHVEKMKVNEAKLTELEAINKLRPQWKKVMRELKMHCKRAGIIVR